jgi:hypothetical protein
MFLSRNRITRATAFRPGCLMLRRILLCALPSICLLQSCSEKSLRESNNNPVFEIKNVSTVLDSTQEFTWSYETRGLIMTKDPSLQQGAVNVYLLRRPSPVPKNYKREWVHSTAILQDGAGEITATTAYSKRSYPEDPGAPKVDWKVIGFARINPAQLKVE